MQSYVPDATTREQLKDRARREQTGPRAEFWRSLPDLPARPESGHKGTFGTAVAVGGSRGMSGAISLMGSACLYAGAGLTQLIVPDAVLETDAQFQREYTTIPCPCDAEGRFVDLSESANDKLNKATAVAVGPGMGRSDALDRLVETLYATLEKPAVFDADALNALAAKGIRLVDAPRAERIITPHPGEFERLFGVKPGPDRGERIASAVKALQYLARLYESKLQGDFTLVLKGRETIVARLDSRLEPLDARVNETGNANLATGGSGDALTGIILGLLAQGMSGFDAARLGVALHGLAAELRATICSRGAVASDVVRFLPVAFDYYQQARGK